MRSQSRLLGHVKSMNSDLDWQVYGRSSSPGVNGSIVLHVLYGPLYYNVHPLHARNENITDWEIQHCYKWLFEKYGDNKAY